MFPRDGVESMTSSSEERNAAQRAADRRVELRYDGGLPATFTYTPKSGGGVRAVACTVVSLSASAMVIVAPLQGVVGEHLWVELDGFGLVRCEIEQVRDDGFVCINLLKEDAARRLAIWVSWLRRRGGRVAGDQREFMRLRPRDARTTIMFPDGSATDVLLTDVSRSGAAVACNRPVEVGDELQIGRVPAQVVRIVEGGFAVAFRQVLDAADADRLVAGYEVVVNPSSKAS
jgi:hypothetical protein